MGKDISPHRRQIEQKFTRYISRGWIMTNRKLGDLKDHNFCHLEDEKRETERLRCWRWLERGSEDGQVMRWAVVKEEKATEECVGGDKLGAATPK